MNITRSTNQFSKLVFVYGTGSWSGTNLGGLDFMKEFEEGGEQEFGGISHFKNVTDYIINHRS